MSLADKIHKSMFVVMIETKGGNKWPHAIFDNRTNAEGEAWRIRKYWCREAEVIEMELNEPGHEP